MEARSHIHVNTAVILRLATALVVVAMFAWTAEPAVPAIYAQGPARDSGSCAPGVQFIGFTDVLDKTSFRGYGVAELSGIAYDEQTDHYYSVADRADLIHSHFFTLDIPVDQSTLDDTTVLAVTELSNEGIAYDGFTLDAEGIVVNGDELLVASESGKASGQQPEIIRFSKDGAQLGSLPVPDRFLVGANNVTFESLALSPKGHSLFTANERPLKAVGSSPADGRTADLRNRIRILRYEDSGLGFVPVAQYFYLTEPDRVASPDDVGVVDLLALSDKDLLVLERGFYAPEGNTVRIFHVSTANAMDVSGEPTLAAPGLVPLAKTLLVDLVNCPESGATMPPGAIQPNALFDNFEDMTLGPQRPGGRQTLLLQSDDNLGNNQTTRLIALSVPISRLVGPD